jgi:hypothetical protein
MRKIIVVTVLVLIALLAVPLKKKYIPKKDSTYIKTNIKVDAPDLIMNNTNENDMLEEKDIKFKDFSIFYQTPKPALIQYETDTIKSIIYSRNQKGKMMYRNNTSESISK